MEFSIESSKIVVVDIFYINIFNSKFKQPSRLRERKLIQTRENEEVLIKKIPDSHMKEEKDEVKNE